MSPELVTLSIDAKEVTVPSGTLIIRAAEQLGIEIPRFCDHPFLAPAGACRQCYVRIEGQPKLATSCTITVAPGMSVHTQATDETVQEAQVANLEFLLLNHPLDCPICDRGGECPLQDQALAFGPGDSRFRDAKRVWPKPLPLSPLVNLDRERCVLCQRCTRFCDEISGDRFIELFERGAGERVSIAAGEDFESPFSGNTVQICPVGALTATPYRFVARPFDLTSADTTCQHCSAGCAVRTDLRRGEVVRVLARDDAEVNDAWICDKGRFAYQTADAPERITTPLIRDRGLEPASFVEVISAVADRVRNKRVAILAGGRLCDEDAYALSKLARTVLRTNDLDHRRAGGPPIAERRAASAPTAVTYRDVEQASAILVAGLDAEQEVPILHLRLRKAAARGAKIWVLHPRRTRLHDVAEHVLAAPGRDAEVLALAARGEPTGEPALDEAVAALGASGPTGVVIAGERLTAQGGDQALALAGATGARFAWVTRRAGDRGALRAGVHPGLLPGGRPLDDPEAAAEVERLWGSPVPREPGRGTAEILAACAEGEIDVLLLFGIDPLRDLPGADLVRRALENVPDVVVQGTELGELERYATAFLPAAAFVERDGHVSTWEGRARRVRPVREPAGIARPDWEILASLALACGGDLGFESLDELQAEMAELLPGGAQSSAAGAGVGATVASPGGGGAIGGATEASESEPVAPVRAGASTASLTLLTYPLLVDEGRLSEGAEELKRALGHPAALEVHPDDAESVGVTHGDAAILRTDAGSAELPVTVTPHIARGAVFVPFNAPGLAANTLLAGGAMTTPATVGPAAGAASEPVDAEVPA